MSTVAERVRAIRIAPIPLPPRKFKPLSTCQRDALLDCSREPLVKMKNGWARAKGPKVNLATVASLVLQGYLQLSPDGTRAYLTDAGIELLSRPPHEAAELGAAAP